jgi:nicotinamidase-related amidase
MLHRRIPMFRATGLALAAAISFLCDSLALCSSDTAKNTIIEEWGKVKTPPPPELKPITVDPEVTALLLLDIQNSNCNPEKRPRCVGTLPGIQSLLAAAREKKMPVIYTLTRGASETDIRKELSPFAGEPIVKSGVDKFFRTDLEEILKSRGIQTVILVGTSAHGAVLHTATGAAQRGLKVIVPVDGMSADDVYAEQYTCWHLVNSPGARRQTTLTRIRLITF